MADDVDRKFVYDQIDGVNDAIMTVDKNATHRIGFVKDEVAALRKLVGDPMKNAEKEIADLKARVKDLESKMGKMKK